MAGEKTTKSIRNAIAWLRNAANQARLDGDDETADRVMALLRIISETMPGVARSAAATPYVGFSNETLVKQPLLKADDSAERLRAALKAAIAMAGTGTHWRYQAHIISELTNVELDELHADERLLGRLEMFANGVTDDWKAP